MKIRCIIVEDEQLPRALLESFIQKTPQLQLIGQFKHPHDAIAFLQAQEVDLMFLDIQLPRLTGVSMLKLLTKKPMVIFTTAYPDYALQGYELDVIDYLLKPFTFMRFMQGVQKVMDLMTLKRKAEKNVSSQDFITITTHRKMQKLYLEEVLYVQGLKEYVSFFTTDERIVILESLKHLEKILPSDRFLRVHKSFIVALDQIRSLQGSWLSVGKAKIPIGRHYKETVLKILKSS